MRNNSDDIGYLPRLNSVRVFIVLAIALGYASTMPTGPQDKEFLTHLGYEPSWIGVQLIFFFSGFLALSSLRRHQSALKYLASKAYRNLPLLFAFTLAAVVVIYPLFGVKTGNSAELFKKLLRYTFDTVSCLDPGRPLPGLLDEAKYMCLIQGAVWTFRYGVILHVGAAIGWKLKLFSKRWLVAIYAILTTLGYMVLMSLWVSTGNSIFEVPSIGLRLAYPFLIGMAVYEYREHLPKTSACKIIVMASLLGLSALYYAFLPILTWTPAIEILLCGFWGYSALLLVQSRTSKLAWIENWPHLALGLYLANWPVSQLILLASPNMSGITLIALSLPVSLLIAYVTHIAITGPMNARRRLGPLLTRVH